MSHPHKNPQPPSEAALRSQLLYPLVIPPNPNGVVSAEGEESREKINPHPTSLMRAYVHQKLSILPSLFKNYDPGVQYVRDLVAQDFEPQERPTVMRVFWDAFHGLENDGKSPFPDVWMDWREQRQEALSRTIARKNFNALEETLYADQKLPAKETSRKSPFNPLSSDFTTKGEAREYAEETTGVRAVSSRQSLRAKLVDIPPRNSKGQLNLATCTPEVLGAICTIASPLSGLGRSIVQRNSISGELPEKSSISTSYLPSSEPLSRTMTGKTVDSEDFNLSKEGTSSEFHHTRRKSFDWIKMSDGSTKSYDSSKASVYLNQASDSNFGAESTKTQSYQSNASGVPSDSGGDDVGDFELRLTNFKESNPRPELRSRNFADLLLPIKEISRGQGKAVVSKSVQSSVAPPTTNSLMSVLEREDTERARIQGQASVAGVLPSKVYSPNISQELSRKSGSTISLGDSEGGAFIGTGDEPPEVSNQTQHMGNAVHSRLDEVRVPENSEFRSHHPPKIKKTNKNTSSRGLKTSAKVRPRFSLTSLPRSLSAVDKILPSGGPVKVSHLGPTPEENEVEDINNTTHAKPLMESGTHSGKAPGRWAKSSFTKAIGGILQEGVERTIPHLGRKSIPREIIGALPHSDTPPLKISSSSSTPNIIQLAVPNNHIPRSNSIPLKKLLDITNSGKHENKGKPTDLLPWEGQHSENSDNESLSDKVPRGPGGEYVAQTFPAAKDKSLPAVTISPMDQASLYGWAECTVVQACSDFLRAQKLNLDIALLGKEVKKWEDEKIRLSTGQTKRRDKVIEFMFGMEIQCRLIEGNMKYASVLYLNNPWHANISDRTLRFSGPAALNPANIISAWKAIIPSFSPRTYCIPDYLILEHFRVLEKVLGLFGPVYYDVEKFESRRSELVRYIMRAGDSKRRLLSMQKLAILREEREKAEEELLKEVGLLTIGEEE
ncbi:hypothetical protein C7212DRAFT_340611 [Tuber magnatum]|uniref:Uncharacterized protein n=1 Tax=Tuber magnatum TaxID=42249 RepID=A0A317T1P9_9PEZI|nr:hypothetical protein C7212DRAFT_340611 [Tuber magnatum]